MILAPATLATSAPIRAVRAAPFVGVIRQPHHRDPVETMDGTAEAGAPEGAAHLPHGAIAVEAWRTVVVVRLLAPSRELRPDDWEGLARLTHLPLEADIDLLPEKRVLQMGPEAVLDLHLLRDTVLDEAVLVPGPARHGLRRGDVGIRTSHLQGERGGMRGRLRLIGIAGIDGKERRNGSLDTNVVLSICV